MYEDMATTYEDTETVAHMNLSQFIVINVKPLIIYYRMCYLSSQYSNCRCLISNFKGHEEHIAQRPADVRSFRVGFMIVWQQCSGNLNKTEIY